MLVGVGVLGHGHNVEGGILDVKVVGNEGEIFGEEVTGIWGVGWHGGQLWGGAFLGGGRLLGIQSRGCESGCKVAMERGS